MRSRTGIYFLVTLALLSVFACQKPAASPKEERPEPPQEEQSTAPAFRFAVTDLNFAPGQTARIFFRHEGVRITSRTVPAGWKVDTESADDEIVLTAPSPEGNGFASGGTIVFSGVWNGKNLTSNEMSVNLLGINSQSDWEAFSNGTTEGFIADGTVSVNCDVTAGKSVASLDFPLDAHGHTITLDIPAENSRGGLFGSLKASVSNLKLTGSICRNAYGSNDAVASLAASCADGVRLGNVSSSAEVAIDLQTRHIDACVIEGLVGIGKPAMENCSFTGTFKALNCDCGQAASAFSNPVEMDIPTGCFSLRQNKILADDIGNSYILQTEGGKVLVFDGGPAGEADNLKKIIGEKYGNRVDEWWISHPHGDHMGAFCSIMGSNDAPSIGKVVHSKVPDKILAAEGTSLGSYVSTLNKFQSKGGEVVDLRQVGARYEIDGVFIKVLGIATEDFPQKASPYPSPVNNASVVLRIWDREKSLIFLGDAQELKGNQVLAAFGPYMHCDYIQMGHHGNWTCGKAFYDAVDFKAALWPSPSWLYKCKSNNASKWDCWQYRNWVAAKGVSENHASCDGDWFLDMNVKK